MAIRPGPIIEGARQYGSSFLPAADQGTLVTNPPDPLRNLRGSQVNSTQQRRELDALARLNQLHSEQRTDDDRLNARVAAFELAFRMQTEAPGAFDLTGETAARGHQEVLTGRKRNNLAVSVCWPVALWNEVFALYNWMIPPADFSRGTNMAISRLATRKMRRQPINRSPDSCPILNPAVSLMRRLSFTAVSLGGHRRLREKTAAIITHLVLQCGWLAVVFEAV